jgi:hypothetical protein
MICVEAFEGGVSEGSSGEEQLPSWAETVRLFAEAEDDANGGRLSFF